ncbi:type VI secretion protein [Chitinispirillum alkaliphilum]|nr:type VI secretion protein [Chitinispirillum alkaliphilum]
MYIVQINNDNNNSEILVTRKGFIMESTSPIEQLSPWSVVIAGNFTPGNSLNQTFTIDKNSFRDLFEALKPTLNFPVKNFCQPDAKHLDVSLGFSAIKDFTPDALVTQIPELAWLLQIRDKLGLYRQGAIDPQSLSELIHRHPLPNSIYNKITALPDFPSSQITQTAHSHNSNTSDPESQNPLDAILSMMDTTVPTHNLSNGSGTSEKMVSGSETKTQPQRPGSGNQVQTIIDAVDAILEMQINEVLHHPDFLKLETAWRELKFIVDRTDFRANITIEVITCEKQALDTTLLETVFKPIWYEGKTAPDLVASLHPFDRSAPDHKMALNLAQAAASTQTLMLLSADAAFFGAPHYYSLRTSVPSIQSTLNGCGYETWRELRNKEEADWLIIAANSFYLRSSYGPDGISVKGFNFRENHQPQLMPCGSASSVIVSMVTELAAELGTENIMQFQHKAKLSEISALHCYTDLNSGKTQTSVNSLSGDQVWDMSDSGLTPVNCTPGTLSIELDGTKTYGNSNYPIPSLLMAGHIYRISAGIIENHKALPCNELEALITASLAKLMCRKIQVTPAGQIAEVLVTQVSGGMHNVTVKANVPYPLWGEDILVNLSFDG